MSKLTVANWANQPDAVVFGHCNPTNLAPYEQVRLLFKEMNTAMEGNVNIYVVADNVERQMMLLELEYRKSTTPVMPVVFVYASLLQELQNPGISKWWEAACVTIVARIDQYYSAPFALSILELVKWAANPTSETRLRFLTVSAFEEPEESIQKALYYFCPKLTVSLVESPTQIQIDHAAPIRRLWADAESFDEAVELLRDQASRRMTSIVLCHPDEAWEMSMGLSSINSYFNEIHYSDRFLKEFLEFRDGLGETAPAVIFCLEPRQIPIEVKNLGAIIISRRRQAALWEYGLVVQKPEQTSQWEVEQAISYVLQTSSPKIGVTILAPETSKLRKLPRRRVDNDQAIPFLVNLFANFDGLDTGRMLLCFVTDFPIFDFNVSQLKLMKCVRESNDAARMFSLVPGNSQKLLLDLLPQFQYQFLPAWFLATGITLPGATVSAKKAMIRLAAIVYQGMDFINDQSIFWQQVPDSEKVERLQTLAYKISMQFRMPHELMKQGGLWAALAAWHSASVTMEGFKDVVNAKKLKDTIKDIANETGIMYIQTQLAEQIGDLVERLEDFVGISPKDKGNIPLFLDENDCEVIENVMVRTWMHRAVGIVKRVLADGETYLRASSLVSMDSTLRLSWQCLVPIGAVLGSRGTIDDAMILAAMSLVRSLRPRTGVQAGACVVLPAERMREWETNNDQDFAIQLRCPHPLVEEPEV
ncbi:hypothetical protein MHUMG1_07967 [Metarhizium humberi]|uniref:Uncharacterized protein n=1 Tax=Metarhizium humberi TaxID=2596975 RepID=A0A9P8M5E3_9HYPO|nr:hypothetical protein MHUMG1_07967 [Metarhizium humberi]